MYVRKWTREACVKSFVWLVCAIKSRMFTDFLHSVNDGTPDTQGVSFGSDAVKNSNTSWIDVERWACDQKP